MVFLLMREATDPKGVSAENSSVLAFWARPKTQARFHGFCGLSQQCCVCHISACARCDVLSAVLCNFDRKTLLGLRGGGGGSGRGGNPAQSIALHLKSLGFVNPFPPHDENVLVTSACKWPEHPCPHDESARQHNKTYVLPSNIQGLLDQNLEFIHIFLPKNHIGSEPVGRVLGLGFRG